MIVFQKVMQSKEIDISGGESKWEVSIKSLPSELRECLERGGEQMEEPDREETTENQRTWLSESCKQA